MKGQNKAKRTMGSGEAGSMHDAGIISAGQKVEHYEPASYETLLQFAEMIGLTEAVRLPEVSINEENAVNGKL